MNLVHEPLKARPLTPEPVAKPEQGQPVQDDREHDVHGREHWAQDPDFALVRCRILHQLVLNLFKDVFSLGTELDIVIGFFQHNTEPKVTASFSIPWKPLIPN